MLIRKKQTKTLSLSIAMSMDDHKRLERIKTEAEHQGFDIDLRGAIHDALLKLMSRAERELKPAQSKAQHAPNRPDSGG